MIPPFDQMAEDMLGDMLMPYYDEGAMAQMISSVLNASAELSKLVIENRKHNSQKMSDEDIYEIYSKSFTHILNTTSDINK
jgi:hypothetical protein